MEKVRPQINNIKKVKKKNTYYWTKRRCLLSCRPYLDVQKVEIINKSDVLEDIRKIIITGFGIKAVQK